ncbi:MAG: DUF1571 domain-containing protein [Geobacter sp.]|nr:DUF1571 domain-containing protein [Geobacter sp.]
MLLTALPLVAADPITAALERFKKVDSYKVTLRSKSRGEDEVIRYYYRKPGFVRMEFVTPHSGAVLVYDPGKKKVRLRAFPSMKSLVFTFDPGSRTVRSSQGHRVDASDVGTLLRRVQKLQKDGSTVSAGEEEVGGRKAQRVEVTGKGGAVFEGVHRYRLWLDAGIFLPRKVIAYDEAGKVVEEVLMDDLAIDVPLPEGLFEL